jgi:hypothetical protein
MSPVRSVYGFSFGLRGFNVRADGNDRELASGGSNGGSRKSGQYGNEGRIYDRLVNSGDDLFHGLGLRPDEHAGVGLFLPVQEIN